MSPKASFESDNTEPVAVELDSLGYSTDVERESIEDPNSDAIRKPFDPDKIEVMTRNPTVSLMLSRIRRGTIDLAPEFQRHAGIWSKQNQSRLIESLLLRIPLPTFYAAEIDDDNWAVVDGIQRLTTIARFMDHEAIKAEPFALANLEYLDEYNGATFYDLPGRLKTRLEETEIVLHLIRKGTPEEVKFNIFARINTGGLPLSRQELRHALIPGKARNILEELATSDAFIEATSESVSSERMADREMVLRFLAFRINPPGKYATQDFDYFLRQQMRSINRLPHNSIDRLRREFNEAMNLARQIFGRNAFRKMYVINPGSRYPINKALFETVAVNLSTRTRVAGKNLVHQRDQVVQAMVDLMNDPKFDRAISVGTGDVAKVHKRFDEVNQLLARFERS